MEPRLPAKQPGVPGRGGRLREAWRNRPPWMALTSRGRTRLHTRRLDRVRLANDRILTLFRMQSEIIGGLNQALNSIRRMQKQHNLPAVDRTNLAEYERRLSALHTRLALANGLLNNFNNRFAALQAEMATAQETVAQSSALRKRVDLLAELDQEARRLLRGHEHLEDGKARDVLTTTADYVARLNLVTLGSPKPVQEKIALLERMGRPASP